MRRADLADLTAFVAVADNLSFRVAASNIGVTPVSAQPHDAAARGASWSAIAEPDDAERLAHRCGLRLFDRPRPAIEQIRGRWTTSKASKGIPSGTCAFT